jgi:ABC-type transport system involved in cytochrome bd biosynthesis fused ATPase/permease subunit
LIDMPDMAHGHRREDGPTMMRQPTDGSIVQARRLRKFHHGANQVEALRGIELDVERGEMVAIVGPTRTGSAPE